MNMKRLLCAVCVCTLLMTGTAFAEEEKNDGEGCIFDFSQTLADSETRIRVNDYVDLIFRGNYGTDKENLRVWTTPIPEVTEVLGDDDLEFYIFGAEPKFAKEVEVVIDGDDASYLYAYRDGQISRVDAVYENNAWRFKTKKLGAYFLAEEEYPNAETAAESTGS